ncbi:MAG: hypothetical protein ABI654_06765 [Betaproteobacteria bacterium]
MSGLEQALAGAQHSTVTAAATRSAFIIGNTGKLGEELLNVLLESTLYSQVCVGVRKTMRSHVAKLASVVVPAGRGDWDPCADMKRAPEDLYLCIEPEAKSFWKIAKPYVAISSEWAAALARRMRAAGARRLAVITPLEALLQMGAVPAIRDTDELAILAAGFERTLLLRPVGDATSAPASGFFEKVGGGVVRTLGSYMTPQALQPVRVRQVARMAVDTLATMGDGVQVIGASRLRELVGDPLGGKRAY